MNYSIKNTTSLERMNLVKKALGISLTGASKPSDKAISLINKYIDGEMELDEIRKILVEEYKEDEI